MKLLFYLAFGFSIWMFIDAVRRRAELHWLLLLFLFAPLSSVIYFFVVKIHDYDLRRFRVLAGAGPNLSQLRLRAAQTPSVSNRLALGDALEAEEQYAEASDCFGQVLRTTPDDKRALHGMARAELGLGRPAEAAERLERLMELDNSYRDYSAALDYAEALWQNGRQQDCIDLLQGLVGVSGRINHRLALAHYLALADKPAPARDQLEAALRDYETAPAFIKRRDRKWAERARGMLIELG